MCVCALIEPGEGHDSVAALARTVRYTLYVYTSTYLLCSPDYRAPLRVGKGQTEMMIPPPFDEALMMIDDHRENLNLCSGILFYFIFCFYFVEVVEISFRFCNKEAKNNTITQGEERAFFPWGKRENQTIIITLSSCERLERKWPIIEMCSNGK